MNAEEVKYFLRLRYSKTWVLYEEFRPFTGFAGNVNQIDAIAIGLYEKNAKIISFEIKTDRGDFLKDVSQFMHKHRFALEISNEFYYVCPWGLIDKSELPDIAGLLYVNKAHKLQTKKVPMLRTKDDIPLCYVQAILQNSTKRIDYTKIPVQYLGRNWTQKDFMGEINKKIEEKLKQRFEWEIKEQVKKRLKEEDAFCLKFETLMEKAGLAYSYREDPDEAYLRLGEMVGKNLEMNRVKEDIKYAVSALEKALVDYKKKQAKDE